MILTLLLHVFLHALIDVGVGVFFFWAASRIFKAFRLHQEYMFFFSYLRNGSMLEEHKEFRHEYLKFKVRQQRLMEFYRGCDQCPNMVCPQREKWNKLKTILK